MIVRCRRMIDNDEWEQLAGKEGYNVIKEAPKLSQKYEILWSNVANKH